MNQILPIKEVQFSILAADQLILQSVAEINKSSLSGPNTVYDLRLGVTNNHSICQTCLNTVQDCPGHFGHITLNHPIAHPLFTTQIVNYLRCLCEKCHHLRLTNDQMLLLNLDWTKVNNSSKQTAFFNRLIEQATKFDICGYCQAKLPQYFANDLGIYKFYNKKETNIALNDNDILDIFSNVPQSEVIKMGLTNPDVHPQNLIITVLPVLPSTTRPACVTDNGDKDDDLTYKYVEIIKKNNKLAVCSNEGQTQRLVEELRDHIRTLFDNSKGQAVQINGRPIKALKARLNGKTGLIRWHLSGKRVDYSARSVISPDPLIRTDEIAIPAEIASSQTFPERVTTQNMQYLLDLINNGKANYIIDGKTQQRRDLKWMLNKNFKILPEDYVLRSKNQQQTVLQQLWRNFNTAENEAESFHQLAKIAPCIIRNLTSNILMENIFVFQVKEYEENKRKKIELQKGDILIRNSQLYCDFAGNKIQLRRNDAVIRQTNVIVIEVCNGTKFVHQNREFYLENGDLVQRADYTIGNFSTNIKKKQFAGLKIGDIVERHLQTGDYIAFGRQPTLHKGSLLGRRIRIFENEADLNWNFNNRFPVKTIRMPLAVTRSYNADFDGDEMNVYSSQSYETISELRHIASTAANLKSGQSGRLFVSLHQDSMTGGYLLTKSREFKTNYDDYYLKCLTADCVWNGPQKITDIQKEAVLYTSKTPISKALFYDCCTSLVDISIGDIIDKMEHIRKTLKYYAAIDNENIFNGHNLFSLVLPNDFEYAQYISETNFVIISRGVMLTGSLCKTVIGDSHNSMIHALERNYGSNAAVQFVTNYEFIINHWLLHRGFSVGISDCVLSKSIDLNETIHKAYLEANVTTENEKDENVRERKITATLNNANNIGQLLCKKAVDFNNNFKSMIEAGAKGSYVNIAQITAVIGQQNMQNGRIEETYDGRTLPHCIQHKIDQVNDSFEIQMQKSTEIYRNRGFVSNSYYKKLHPLEVWFHAAAGRIGLIDTACSTSATGYAQRKLVKFLEDLKYTYAGTVTNAREAVIQWNYGKSIDPGRLIRTKLGDFQFMDVSSVVSKLNMDFETQEESEEENSLE